LLGHLEPEGSGPDFVWSVQLADGWLYASDMLNGLWQVAVE
jgi:hypothetical protein